MSGDVLRQGAADGAECVADLGSEQAHDSNDNDGDECENNGILDESLAFFLRCKQHENLPFDKKTDGLLRTSLSADSMTVSGVKSYMGAPAYWYPHKILLAKTQPGNAGVSAKIYR
jgi:hypothetical protein